MDIALTQIEPGLFDLSIDGPDLTTDEGMSTAIIISLFTDTRVTADDLPSGDDDKRGWWSDIIGSKLWLLERALAIKETLDRAESYSAEALQWMVDIGVARAIAPNAQWLRSGVMLLVIDVVKPNGDTASFKFEDVWSAQINGV